MSRLPQERQPAMMICFCGGTGNAAGRYFRDLYEADGKPFVARTVHLDTDPVTSPWFDQSILLSLSEADALAIQADPSAFGPIAEAIVQQYPELLHEEDIQHGSRTTRLLTQLAFVYHRSAVLSELRRGIHSLLHEGGFDYIVVLLVSSSGGGAGSALQILLPQALKQPSFRGRLLEGLPTGILRTPIAFIGEPFAFAMRHQEMHSAKILANALALRIEAAELARQRTLKYVFSLGLANRAGAVLDHPEEIARVLGTSVYQFARSWQPIKSRLVDTVDLNMYRVRYRGRDLPDYSSNGNAHQE